MFPIISIAQNLSRIHTWYLFPGLLGIKISLFDCVIDDFTYISLLSTQFLIHPTSTHIKAIYIKPIHRSSSHIPRYSSSVTDWISINYHHGQPIPQVSRQCRGGSSVLRHVVSSDNPNSTPSNFTEVKLLIQPPMPEQSQSMLRRVSCSTTPL